MPTARGFSRKLICSVQRRFLFRKDFLRHGASPEKVKIWGVPLDAKFRRLGKTERRAGREKICERLGFDLNEPLILVSGGGEGLGKIEAVVKESLKLKTNIIVLCGRNEKLKVRCEKPGFKTGLRVLGWTEKVSDLMQSADDSKNFGYSEGGKHQSDVFFNRQPR